MAKATAKAHADKEVWSASQSGAVTNYDDTVGCYTAKDLADQLEVKTKVAIRSATLRSRWMPYVVKAIGEHRAKPDGLLYSSLALHLVVRFYKEIAANNWPPKVQGMKAKQWVLAISEEYPATPVEKKEEAIDAEFVDAEPGTLAQQGISYVERASDRVDSMASALAKARHQLEQEKQALLADVEENEFLRREAKLLAVEARKLEVQREELRLIQQKQQSQAQEQEWREEVRASLGKHQIKGADG